jgi:hypothetical protein
MTHLVGMYIAHEACLLDSIGRQAYVKQCETKFDEAEETLVYFEPSDSEKHYGKLKLYQVYLAKLREIAWSINVRPKDFLNYVISAEYESFVNLNKESSLDKYIARLGQYRDKMNEVFDSPRPCIYMVPREWKSDFVPANKLKNQGGDNLR